MTPSEEEQEAAYAALKEHKQAMQSTKPTRQNVGKKPTTMSEEERSVELTADWGERKGGGIATFSLAY